MKVQILLISGAFPRYFAGFGQTQAGKSCVIATPQAFHAKYYDQSVAAKALELLSRSYPFAKIVTA